MFILTSFYISCTFYDYESEYNYFYYNPLITLFKAVTPNTNITHSCLYHHQMVDVLTKILRRKKINIFLRSLEILDITLHTLSYQLYMNYVIYIINILDDNPCVCAGEFL